MLTFYTSSKPAAVSGTFGVSLKSFRPDVPPHRFVTCVAGGPLPEPVAGEVMLMCGAEPFLQLQAAGLAPKNRTITSMREKPIQAKAGGWYLITFDPGILGTQPDKREILDWDVRVAHRLMTTGSMKPNVGDYVWVASYVQLIAEIEAEFEKTGRPVKVAMDTETMGLYPWYADKDIVSISFTARKGRSEMLYFGPQPGATPLDHSSPIWDQIHWLLNSPKVRLRGSNLKYDLVWIAVKWGIECTNFKFDNLLVASLLNENRNNSLNLHAKLFTDFGGYDDSFNHTFDKGKMEQVPIEDLRVYAGGDTDAAYQVADVLQGELAEDAQLHRFYCTILHPAARAFEKIERRGVLVDQEKFAVLRADLKAAIKESTEKQLTLLPGKLKIKYRDRIDDQLADGKNPMLPSILRDYFFTTSGLNLKPQTLTPKDKQPSTAKSHLKQVARGVPEAMAMIDEMTIGDTAGKMLSTFVDGFMKHLRPDSRFHPGYMLFHGGFGDDEDDESGTVTGRLSAKEPAFQTIPKKKPKKGENWPKRLRACYPAPPGKVVFNVDYSQGELKVVACIAPEPTMIQAFLDKKDLHALTGAKVASVPFDTFMTWKENADKQKAEEFERVRGNAKPVNFGLLYDQTPAGFVDFAWKAYGVIFTLAEGEKIVKDFFDLYPGLPVYHANQRKFARQNGFVRSPLGRIRHLPAIASFDWKVKSKAERQAINSPIQSCLADMMEWAIALLDQRFPNEEVQVAGNVHDAIVGYMDADKVDVLLPQVVDIMSNLPLHELGWHPPLQFTVDAEVGPNMAELTKFKPAALKLAA